MIYIIWSGPGFYGLIPWDGVKIWIKTPKFFVGMKRSYFSYQPNNIPKY